MYVERVDLPILFTVKVHGADRPLTSCKLGRIQVVDPIFSSFRQINDI